MITVTFFGAVRTVTGSMHLVETGDTRLLLDCGLFQGRRADARRVNSEFPFSPSSIDTVVLSHAHLDHCGNLPTLVQQGFRGTRPTGIPRQDFVYPGHARPGCAHPPRQCRDSAPGRKFRQQGPGPAGTAATPASLHHRRRGAGDPSTESSPVSSNVSGRPGDGCFLRRGTHPRQRGYRARGRRPDDRVLRRSWADCCADHPGPRIPSRRRRPTHHGSDLW